LTSPTIQLIAGINLPLLLEVLIAQGDGLKLEEINVTELVENAKSSLVHINPLLETVNQE
jgi:mannose/fructose-specific phosphotransferase system component IIA